MSSGWFLTYLHPQALPVLLFHLTISASTSSNFLQGLWFCYGTSRWVLNLFFLFASEPNLICLFPYRATESESGVSVWVRFFPLIVSLELLNYCNGVFWRTKASRMHFLVIGKQIETPLITSHGLLGDVSKVLPFLVGQEGRTFELAPVLFQTWISKRVFD